MKTFIFVCLVSAIVFPLSSLAKQKNSKRQEVSFDGTDIDGVARNPNASYIVQKRGIDFVPLYKVREAYDDSIKESLDYLR